MKIPRNLFDKAQLDALANIGITFDLDKDYSGDEIASIEEKIENAMLDNGFSDGGAPNDNCAFWEKLFDTFQDTMDEAYRGKPMTYDLSRFKKAQAHSYETALSEIRAGEKQSHWMWYIFPQLEGLGFSEIARYYGINGIAEARAYLADDVLRTRLVEISQALLALASNDATAVMGYPDDLKLKSCMTLFLLAAEDGGARYATEAGVFKGVLEKFFGGKIDERTVGMMKK